MTAEVEASPPSMDTVFMWDSNDRSLRWHVHKSRDTYQLADDEDLFAGRYVYECGGTVLELDRPALAFFPCGLICSACEAEVRKRGLTVLVP